MLSPPVRGLALLALALSTACGGQTGDGTGSTSPGAGGSSLGAGGGSAGSGVGKGGSTAAGGSAPATGGFGGDFAGPCSDTPPACSNCGPGTPNVAPMCTPMGWECPMTSCPPPPLCVGPGQCPSGTYCVGLTVVCPNATNPGHCVTGPQDCPSLYDPHCGCFSGKEYPNECVAQTFGEASVPCNGPGAGGAGGTGSGGSGAGGGGPSEKCGPGATLCPIGYYCDHHDKQCGSGDAGTCEPAPDKCGGDGLACGCDGKVYANACAAELVGVDLSLIANACAQPAGTFLCGYHFCNYGSEYCEMDGSDIGGFANAYACHPLPPECFMGAPTTCACLAGVTCGGNCAMDASGAMTVTCLGG